ncbi:MAG: hypothetical protein IT184_15280 [Acidobacteria bacterium]|nr:hypothetical protein [Acidobacteriota bacterium]
MQPDDLERLIDRELRALPAPRAPRSLVPRVMAAIDARQAMPWYRRGWSQWPPVWRTTSLAALTVVAVALLIGWPALAGSLGGWQPDAGTVVPARIRAIGDAAAMALDASRVLWRVLIEPVMGYLVAFVLTMVVACVAFGTALDRVALGGPSEL